MKQILLLVNQQMSKAIIYIEESNSMADVTFPSIPIVISLFDYDDVEQNKPSLPMAGYPVICVTVCAKLMMRLCRFSVTQDMIILRVK